MHRLLIVLFGIVSTVAVAILLFLLYRYAVSQSSAVSISVKTEAPVSFKNRTPEPKSHAWLESLALKKRPAYSYAVSEMEIVLPLKKRDRLKKSIAYPSKISMITRCSAFGSCSRE